MKIDYKDFSRRGAVGDCCSHFIKQNGELFDKKIDARVVGASLETIKKIPNKLVDCRGKRKREDYNSGTSRRTGRQSLY